jgi:hypothetical protein
MFFKDAYGKRRFFIGNGIDRIDDKKLSKISKKDIVSKNIQRDNVSAHKIKSNPTVNTTEFDNVWLNDSFYSTKQNIASLEQKIYFYVPNDVNSLDELVVQDLASPEYLLILFNIFDFKYITEVNNFTNVNPEILRKIVINKLYPFYNRLNGIIFSNLDKSINRIIFNVCTEMSIKTFYLPLCSSATLSDYRHMFNQYIGLNAILSWDTRNVYTKNVDDYKLNIDIAIKTYESSISGDNNKDIFYKILGFDKNIKTIALFLKKVNKTTLETIQQTIKDAVLYTLSNNIQLIINLPETKFDVLSVEIANLIDNHKNIYLNNGFKIFSDKTVINESDFIVSNLIDDLIHPCRKDKLVFFANYLNKESSLVKSIISIRSYDDWSESIGSFLYQNNKLHNFLEDNWINIKQNIIYSVRDALQNINKGDIEIPCVEDPLTLILGKKPINTIGSHFPSESWDSTNKYLLPLLSASQVTNSTYALKKPSSMLAVDIFMQWGIKTSSADSKQKKIANMLGKPVVLVEDGFIRSIDIGLSKEPGLSIILDKITSYYDATKISYLESLLQNGYELNEQQLLRAKKAIDLIVKNKISKYNHAPDIKLNIGENGKRKILVIDQRYGDQSVASGLASEETYAKILSDIIKKNPDADIIIKQHPDAIKGGKSSYYSNERLSFAKYVENIHLINFDVNPYSLLNIVDDVYVGTSGMGFEALMAGKKVYCYGVPFYSGWGITEDDQKLERRTRKRTLEEIFYFVYIVCSRYFNPSKNSIVEIEDIIPYIIEKRGW